MVTIQPRVQSPSKKTGKQLDLGIFIVISARCLPIVRLEISGDLSRDPFVSIVHSLSSGKVAATPILKSVPSKFSPFIL